MTFCTICGLRNYLAAGGNHPCCTFAHQQGDERCGGCEAFQRRCWDCGTTVPLGTTLCGTTHCRKAKKRSQEIAAGDAA